MDAIAARIAAAPNVLAIRVIFLSLAETGADKKSCRSISALSKPAAAHPVPGVVLLLPSCGSAVTVLAAQSVVTACAAYSVSSPGKRGLNNPRPSDRLRALPIDVLEHWIAVLAGTVEP